MPIAILRPTGAGALTEWTPSAGTNWEAVAAAGGAWVLASAAGTRDRYALADLPADATGVASVTAYASAGGDNLGLAYTMRLTIRLSGVESSGTAFLPPDGGYATFSHAFATAPGALAWTVARVNALELGPDVVDTTADSFLVDAVWLAVDYTSATTYPGEAADLPFPDTNGREAEMGQAQSVAMPDTNGREVPFPSTSALDIPLGGETSPAVEMTDEGAI
jgi:hypothetical protein